MLLSGLQWNAKNVHDKYRIQKGQGYQRCLRCTQFIASRAQPRNPPTPLRRWRCDILLSSLAISPKIHKKLYCCRGTARRVLPLVTSKVTFRLTQAFKIIAIHVIRQTIHDFLLAFHCNYISSQISRDHVTPTTPTRRILPRSLASENQSHWAMRRYSYDTIPACDAQA